MVNGIILTVSLKGKLSATVEKCEAVKSMNGNVVLMKNVTFSGKYPTPCARKTHISGEVVSEWIGNKPSNGIKPIIWARMSKTQRLRSYLDMMDEGFGYSFEAL